MNQATTTTAKPSPLRELMLMIMVWVLGWSIVPGVGVTPIGKWLFPGDAVKQIMVGIIASGLLLVPLILTQRSINRELVKRHWSAYLFVLVLLALAVLPLRTGGLDGVIFDLPAWAYVLMAVVNVFMQQYLTFGLLQSYIQRVVASPVWTVIATGLTFYAVHAVMLPHKFAPTHWLAALAILAMGVACAALRQKTGTIYITLALHWTFYFVMI